MRRIENMLPFLDSKDILELAHEILQGNVDLSIEMTLPFLDEDDVDELCDEIASNPHYLENVNLAALYPFASQEYVDKLFLAASQTGTYDMRALPFVSEQSLHTFVLMYIENPNSEIDVDTLYPFLSDEDISLLFRAYLQQHKKSQQV